MIASTDYKEKKKHDYMNSFQTRFAQTFYKLQAIIIWETKYPVLLLLNWK